MSETRLVLSLKCNQKVQIKNKILKTPLLLSPLPLQANSQVQRHKGRIPPRGVGSLPRRRFDRSPDLRGSRMRSSHRLWSRSPVEHRRDSLSSSSLNIFPQNEKVENERRKMNVSRPTPTDKGQVPVRVERKPGGNEGKYQVL